MGKIKLFFFIFMFIIYKGLVAFQNFEIMSMISFEIEEKADF